MKNKDALKKHHFWILLGLVQLFVLIALVMISSGVGGAIEKRESEIETEKKNIASKTAPKSKALLDEMKKMTDKVDGKKGNLHEANWERQKNLYTWPTSNLFKDFSAKVKDGDKDKVIQVARLEDLRFGDVILNTGDQFGEFRKDAFYRYLYSDAEAGKPGVNGMADRVAPTQFKGNGWQDILRYVNSWSEIQLTSDQIWLLMEDVWVQRSLLEAIRSVNEQMSEFTRVKYEKPGGSVIDDPDSKNGPTDPLRRKFRSRTWEVSLEVAKKGNKQYLTGTLENITDRLQVLGIGKMLTLRVWLDGKPGPDGKLDVKNVEPIEFKIGSEFLPGKGGPMKEITDKDGKKKQVPANVVSIQPDENNDKDFDKYINLIPPGTNVVEIVKVEQVFDTQTVPIRRIDAVALGKVDSRYGDNAQLKMPQFIKPDEPPAGGGPDGMGPPMGITFGPGGPMSPGGPFGPGGPMSPRGEGRGVMGGPGGGGQANSGTIDSVVTANRKRYVDVTPQVRRMPVGVVVVVDQAYIQDVLMAFANSPLRFQITQVNWKRFRDGNLGTSIGPGGSSGGGDTPLQSGPGDFGAGFGGSGDPDERRGGSGRPMFPGGGNPFGPGGPIGPGTSGGGRPIGPGGSGQPTFPGGAEGGFPYGPGGGMMTSVSEAQLTSGLVELQIYGIVSLYEKYVPPVDPNAKEKEPDPGPTPKDQKDPKDPMPGTTAPPKTRVRRRVV